MAAENHHFKKKGRKMINLHAILDPSVSGIGGIRLTVMFSKLDLGGSWKEPPVSIDGIN